MDENSTCQNFWQVQNKGNKETSLEIPFYNLDMIISLGYCIKSKILILENNQIKKLN